MMKYPSWDTLYMFHHMIEPRFGRCLPGIRFRRTRKNSTRVCTLTLDSGNLLYFYIFTKSWIQSPWLFEPMLMGSIPAQFEKVFHEVHGTSPWRGDMPVQCFITFPDSSNTQDLFHYFVHTNTSFWNFTLRFQPQTKLIWVHSFFSYCQPEPYEDVFMHIVFMCCQPEPLKHIVNMFSTKGDMTSVIQPLVHTPIPFFANLNCRSYVHHKGCNDKFPSKCTSHDRWRSFTDNCAEAQTGSDHGTWPSSTRAN